jgi:formate hydrogenlyase subunit 4
MTPIAALLRLLVFPGLLFAIPAAWLFLWGERKAIARMQRRIGPPLLQPLYDFVKLLGKRPPVRQGIEGVMLNLWPAIAVVSMVGAIVLLPVLPGSGGFAGDVILLVALLEMPSVCLILAGFTSGSLFGEIGSTREAVLSVSNNLVFLSAIVMIAVVEHTFRLANLAGPSTNPGHWLGVAGILLCIPAKLHLNPFSTSSAEQEIYSGPLTEYAGPELAMWELAHGLEWVALTGLVATLVLPRIGAWWLDAPLFVIVSFGLVLTLAGVAAGTARLTLNRSIRFYWRWALALAVLAVSSAIFMRMKP